MHASIVACGCGEDRRGEVLAFSDVWLRVGDVVGRGGGIELVGRFPRDGVCEGACSEEKGRDEESGREHCGGFLLEVEWTSFGDFGWGWVDRE